MKRNSIFKGIVIIAILCLFVFSACKEPEVQKRITVTGIPSTHNGRVAFAGLYGNNDTVVAYGSPVVISGGTASMLLVIDLNNNVPFTGSGTYSVSFFISDTSVTTLYYTGGIYSKAITAETTTISFTEFIPLSSVQQTPFSIKNAIQMFLKELAE